MKYLEFIKSNALIRTLGNAMSAGWISAALSNSAMGLTGTMLPANIANFIASAREIAAMDSEDFDRDSYDEAKSHPEVKILYIISAVLAFAVLIMMIIKCIDKINKKKKAKAAAEAEAAEEEIITEDEEDEE